VPRLLGRPPVGCTTRSSRRGFVSAEQSAEEVAPPDVRRMEGRCRRWIVSAAAIRQSQVERLVWTLLVEVTDVDAEDVLELAATEDQKPLEAVGCTNSIRPGDLADLQLDRICAPHTRRRAGDAQTQRCSGPIDLTRLVGRPASRGTASVARPANRSVRAHPTSRRSRSNRRRFSLRIPRL
jgi:hypothetical protein